MIMFVNSIEKKLNSVDSAVMKLVANRRNPVIEDAASAISGLCSPVNIIIYLSVSALAAPGIFLDLSINIAAVWTVVYGLKYIFSRERPEGNVEAGLTASFPSAHAATAFTLAPVLSQTMEPAAPLLYLTGFCVASARIYLQSHYLSDVAVGSFLGLAISAIL